MPTATATRKTTRKPVTRRRVVAKPVAPAPVEAAPEEPTFLPDREYWVLQSGWEKFDGPEYFYDGQIDVVGGIAKVPVFRKDWVKRLLFSGYWFTSERDMLEYDASIEA